VIRSVKIYNYFCTFSAKKSGNEAEVVEKCEKIKPDLD